MLGDIRTAPKETQYNKADIWRSFLDELDRNVIVTVNGHTYRGEDLLWGREVQEEFDYEITHQDDGYICECDRDEFIGDPNWDKEEE